MAESEDFLMAYQVRWSFHAGKWWAGEKVGLDMANVHYYDTFREAMDDIKDRLLLDQQLESAENGHSNRR